MGLWSWLTGKRSSSPPATVTKEVSSRTQPQATKPATPTPAPTLPPEPTPIPLPTRELEILRLVLQKLKPEGPRYSDDTDPRSDETPIYNAIVPAKASASGNDEAFELQVLLTTDKTGDKQPIYTAQWTESGSRGKDPKLPRLKEKLPFNGFLNRGNTSGMRTPDDVIRFVQTLYDGYGIRIKFD
ncbi:MAG: hypothetical protein AABX70_07745 [Nanoarchaeota archaeon]